MPTIRVTSKVGELAVSETDGAIVRVQWITPRRRVAAEARSELLERAAAQLRAYFEGELREFDLPLAPAGSAFQQQVYAAMRAIPFGETRTYGDLATELATYGQPIGQACGSNPIPIVIPCHRVLASGGLGGFSAPGGVETKIALLRHEGAFPYLL